MGGRAEQRGNMEGLNRGPVHTSADYSMKPGDFLVVAESAGGAVIVTLPSLAEAIIGAVYTIIAPAGATADVSVYQKETGAELTTYGDLDANADILSVVCAGEAWSVVGSTV